MEIKTSTGERNLIEYLEELWQEGSKYREEQAKGWERAVEVVKGEVWPKRRPAYKVNASMNFLDQIVEKKVALLTDSRPTVRVDAVKPGLDHACTMLTKTIEGILEERHFERKLTEFIFLDQYFGMAYFKTPWNKSLNFGKGSADVEVIDPRAFIFDPFVRRSYNIPFGEYCCFEDVLPQDLLVEKYGVSGDRIKADFGKRDTSAASVVSKIKSFFSQLYGKDAGERSSVIPRSIVRDWWVMDRQTRKKGEGKSKDGSPLEVRAFKSWRHIVVAGGYIVVDDNNPYIDGVLPYDGMDWSFDVNSAYGRNEIAKLEMPQIMLNKLLGITLESSILMSNPIWVGDRDALGEKEWERLNNEPGSYVRKRPGRDLRREAGVALPPSLTTVLTMLATGLKELGGDTEAAGGRKPGQVTSGQGIEALQLAATTTVRLKARQIEYITQEVGQKLISRIFQYMDDDRVYTLLGDTPDVKQFLYERGKLKQILEDAKIPFLSAHEVFQFKVAPASSLSMTKWQRGLIATQLFQLGAIDREALLEAIEYPNREEILKRTIAKQQSGEEPIGRPKGGKIPKQTMKAHQELAMQHPQKG